MIGLFLGEKKLPLEILKSLKKKKIKYFIIDLSKNNKFKKDKNSYFINIGKFGKILELIKSKKCKKVLFAGNIIKPKISKLKLDLKGIYYMPRIIKASKLGDAAILKELINILSENKISVIKLNTYNPELTLGKGCYTKSKPSITDKNNTNIEVKKNLIIWNLNQGQTNSLEFSFWSFNKLLIGISIILLITVLAYLLRFYRFKLGTDLPQLPSK